MAYEALVLNSSLTKEDQARLITEHMLKYDQVVDDDAFIAASQHVRSQLENARQNTVDPYLVGGDDSGPLGLPGFGRLSPADRQLCAIHHIALRKRLGLDRYPPLPPENTDNSNK